MNFKIFFIKLKDIMGNPFLDTLHSKGFSTSCLAVGEHGTEAPL